jgi:translocator protein
MLNWLKNLFSKERTTSRKEKIISGILIFGYIYGLGFASSYPPGEFYRQLIKSALTPPNWVFPVAWTILFFLIGLSGYYIWNHYSSAAKRRLFTLLYLVNGILVFLWSYFFFGQQNITTPLYIILGIVIVAELMILTAFGTNKKAAYVLIPYLAWVLFATYLNASIIALNG